MPGAPPLGPDNGERQKKANENRAVGEESIKNIGSTGKGVAQALQQTAAQDGYQVPKPIEMPTD